MAATATQARRAAWNLDELAGGLGLEHQDLSEPPRGKLREELEELIRSDQGHLGLVQRELEHEPSASPQVIAFRSGVTAAAASTMRQVIQAVLDRRIPPAPSIAVHTSRRVGGLLRHHGISEHAAAYLLALRADLEAAAQESARPQWDLDELEVQLAPGQLDALETAPQGELLEHLLDVLRGDDSQLGEAFRVFESDPEISAAEMTERTSISSPNSVWNLRKAVLAVTERRIPRSPSVSNQVASRVSGLLLDPELTPLTATYLLRLRRDLERAAQRPNREKWDLDALLGESVADTPPSSELRSRLEELLRRDTSQLGDVYRVMEEEPDISARELSKRAKVSPAAAGTLRHVVPAVLDRQIPDSPNVALQAGRRVGGFLRDPSLDRQVAAYLTTLRRDLDDVASKASQRWNMEGIEARMAANSEAVGYEVRPPVDANDVREDVAIANELVAALSEVGIECWIDHGRIVPGRSWAGMIADAVSDVDGLIVLISEYSMDNINVGTEVSMAIDDELPVIPVRIEDVRLRGELKYHLHRIHWVDVIETPRGPAFASLARKIAALGQTPRRA